MSPDGHCCLPAKPCLAASAAWIGQALRIVVADEVRHDGADDPLR
jgi:hypothetical protein